MQDVRRPRVGHSPDGSAPRRRLNPRRGRRGSAVCSPGPARASLAACAAARRWLGPLSALRGLAAPSAGLARRRAALPPRPLALAQCAPSGPPRQGSGRARCALAWPGPSGACAARSRGLPLAALALASSRRWASLPFGRSARRAGLGRRVLRPRLLPPGGSLGGFGGVAPFAASEGCARPPAARSRSRAGEVSNKRDIMQGDETQKKEGETGAFLQEMRGLCKEASPRARA